MSSDKSLAKSAHPGPNLHHFSKKARRNARTNAIALSNPCLSPNLSQTPVGFGIDRLQERLQLPKDFLRRVDALNATQTREQSRNLAPMTLGQLPFDVPLFVNQASLNHTVADELFHSGAQHGTRGGLLEEVGQGWFL
jgi:hypothetical protein